MRNDEKITRRMLSIIRENDNISKKNKKELIKENSNNQSNGFPIKKSTPQFGDVVEAQKQNIIKTLGESVEFEENALIYYYNNKDLVLTGKINSLNIAFQFRYNDPSGDGCYLWANALQLTETNNRTVGKIRDAFVNWKQNLIQDGELIEKLHNAVNQR
jgi:hypothetical protein